ncbi:MAG: Flp pilus assembly protein CpaB [Acidimicrobiales bacterium]
MRRPPNLLVLLGVAFFVVGTLSVYVLTNDSDGTSDGPAGPVPVVVGTQDIAAGSLADELIASGRLVTIEVPANQLTPGAVQSLNQLAGAEFLQGFAKDQQINSTGLRLKNPSIIVPAGFQAVAVQIDFVPAAAGYVTPGDRINLYGVYATPTGNRPTPRVELLLTNVEVLDVDLTIPARDTTATGDGAQRASGSTVTYLLALRTLDAEKVIYTTEFARFYASLTAVDAPPSGPTPGRDADNVLAEEPNDAANR